MAEYIEREAVEKFIMDGLNNSDVYERFGHDAIKIITEVHYMPAADVAPVVRCKDCEYSYDISGRRRCSHGTCCGRAVPPDFYCAEGKRKEPD